MAQDSNTASPSPVRYARPIDAYARFIGKWEVSGDATGSLFYEWLPGGHFILEKVHLVERGHVLEGVSVLGQTRGWRGSPSREVVSRFYDSDGNSLDYIYDLDGDHLTIWLESRDSDAYFEGDFTNASRILTGAWHFPAGGGYSSIATRVDP